jgi:hypothetical protein
MRFVHALTVVGENLDDAAGLDALLPALFDHVLNLCTQGDEAGDLVVDVREVVTCDDISLGARPLGLVGQIEKLSYRLNLKAKLTGMADEPEPSHRSFVIRATIAFGPWRGSASAPIGSDFIAIRLAPLVTRECRVTWNHFEGARHVSGIGQVGNGLGTCRSDN